MAETVPEMVYQNHHHFISESPWQDQPLRDKLATDANQVLGGPDSCLILDETAFTKKGNDSIAVGRQWSGQIGKIDNCQVAVFALLADDKDGCLLDGRLYLPKSWIRDQERCEKAKLPEEYRIYKSKTTLAMELIERMDELAVGYRWILADAGYGKNPKFLHSLNRSGKTFVADVHKSQRVYLANPAEAQRVADHSRLRLTPKAISVEDLIKGLDESQWQWVVTEIGSKGPKQVKVCRQRVWVMDKETGASHQWHLIVRRKGSGGPSDEHKYSLSNAPAETSARKLAWCQGHRCKVEQGFREAKQELGMDEYQVRGWRGWQHHLTLTLMAGWFLLEMKRVHQLKRPLMSLRDIRELLVVLLPRRKRTQGDVLEVVEQRHRERARDIRRNRRKRE